MAILEADAKRGGISAVGRVRRALGEMEARDGRLRGVDGASLLPHRRARSPALRRDLRELEIRLERLHRLCPDLADVQLSPMAAEAARGGDAPGLASTTDVLASIDFRSPERNVRRLPL